MCEFSFNALTHGHKVRERGAGPTCSISVLSSVSAASVPEAGDSQVNVNARVVQGETAGALPAHQGVHNSAFGIGKEPFFPSV